MKSHELAIVAFTTVSVFLVMDALVTGTTFALFLLEQVAGPRGTLDLLPLLHPLVGLTVGVVLFVARDRIARRLFPDDEPTLSGAELDDVQAVGLSFVAAWLALDGGWRIARTVLPMLFYGDKASAPWSDLVPDLLTIGLAIWLFLKAEVVVGLWLRARGRNA